MATNVQLGPLRFALFLLLCAHKAQMATRDWQELLRELEYIGCVMWCFPIVAFAMSRANIALFLECGIRLFAGCLLTNALCLFFAC